MESLKSPSQQRENRIPLTQIAHEAVRRFVTMGDVVIDATVGNGHDTLLLCQLVGSQGVVYGFDIQAAAIAKTRQRIETYYSTPLAVQQQQSFPTLLFYECDHAKIGSQLEPHHIGVVSCVMMNLGYLPGGPKHIKTTTDSTLLAIQSAFQCLRQKQSCLSVIAYTGHEGGKEEAKRVEETLQSLANDHLAKLSRTPNDNIALSPIAFLLER